MVFYAEQKREKEEMDSDMFDDSYDFGGLVIRNPIPQYRGELVHGIGKLPVLRQASER